jgi:hypothetical protein
MTKIFLKSVLGLLLLLVILFVIWYSNVGRKNLYYIEEMNMYIKTFPSRESAIIAFSDKKIGKFSDTLDYIKVNKGDDYGTGFLLDPSEKYVIHISGNSLIETHWQNYKMGKEIAIRDTVYFDYQEAGGYLLKKPYIEISFSLCGATERVSLKNRDDIYYTEIKPIK